MSKPLKLHWFIQIASAATVDRTSTDCVLQYFTSMHLFLSSFFISFFPQIQVSWFGSLPVFSDWTGVWHDSGGGSSVQDYPVGSEYPPINWKDGSRAAVWDKGLWGCNSSTPLPTLWNRWRWTNYCTDCKVPLWRAFIFKGHGCRLGNRKTTKHYYSSVYSEIDPQFKNSVSLRSSFNTDLLSVNLVNYMVLQLFLFKNHVLFQTFWHVPLPSNWKWANLFHETVKCLNIWDVL